MENIVDLTYLETVCEGDKEFMQEMILAFVNAVPENMTEVKSLAAKAEWADVAKVAHKMKPSVTFMGIEPMKAKIIDLETACKQGGSPAHINQLISEIDAIVQVAVVELNKLMAEL